MANRGRLRDQGKNRKRRKIKAVNHDLRILIKNKKIERNLRKVRRLRKINQESDPSLNREID